MMEGRIGAKLFFASILLYSTITLHAQLNNAYTASINEWHKKREVDLVSEKGWLNVAGLFWLEEGTNSFGSGAKNKIIFPKNSIATNAGAFQREGNTVYLIPAANIDYTINGEKILGKKIIFSDSGKPFWVSHNNLRFMVIKRGDKIGVRLKDLASPKLATFKGVERFEVDSNWKVQASIDKNSLATTIPILNVLGQTTETAFGGKLVFFRNNQRYTLDAIDEGESILVVFGDRTSGNTTYHGGRFISIPKTALTGSFALDFNKAYNPPCVFTPYATCPLPPPQNILPFAVTAGEKKYGDH